MNLTSPSVLRRLAQSAFKAAVLAAVFAAAPPLAAAQQSRTRAPGQSDSRSTTAIPGARVVPRDSVIGLVSGGLAGTYIRIANDLAGLFETPDSTLRILPIVSRGSLQNISDLFNLTDVDVAITQSDTLAYLRQNQVITANNTSIGYIAKLYEEEVHVLAAPGITSLADLAGKKVNFDTKGSGTSLTTSVIFKTLGIQPDPTYDDQEVALGKLKRGEISALVYVSGKPARLFADASQTPGLHLLPIPLNPALLETYSPTQFTAADYPGLVPAGTSVDTIAVGAVMAVYNWPPGTYRYNRLSRFVNQVFDNLGTLQKPGHHPKWHDVSLTAQVPGWTRFPAATQWLQRHGSPAAPAVAAAR